jgi:6-phosphogluconolactonase
MITDLDTVLEIHPDKESLSRSVAEAIVALIDQTCKTRPYFSMALAGGSTPRLLYSLLAADYASSIPWDRVKLYWGDERYVPHTDEKSNYRMAKEALLDHVPIPPDQIFPIPTHITNPKEAANSYASQMKRTLSDSDGRLDLVLLGMGDDGHTASLFPGSPALEADQVSVVAAPAPVEPHQRITLTFPSINEARAVYFMVSGKGKAPALRCAFKKTSQITDCPSGRVAPRNGSLVWWVDKDAASLLNG